MSAGTLKWVVIGVFGFIFGLASTSIGKYVLEGTKNTIFEGIGKPVGDILVIIGDSILLVYVIGAIIVIAITIIDYLLQSSSRSRY